MHTVSVQSANISGKPHLTSGDFQDVGEKVEQGHQLHCQPTILTFKQQCSSHETLTVFP